MCIPIQLYCGSVVLHKMYGQRSALGIMTLHVNQFLEGSHTPTQLMQHAVLYDSNINKALLVAIALPVLVIIIVLL